MKKYFVVFVVLISRSSWACTDYSGDWRGTCISKTTSEVEPAVFYGRQKGCESLFTGLFNFEFGKVQKFHPQPLDESGKILDVTTRAEWDLKGDTFRVEMETKGHFEGAPDLIEAARTAATFAIVEGTLRVTEVVDETKPRIKHSERICTLQRE